MPARRHRLDDLIAAAVRVFRSRGYRRTQMADVASELGVTPGALYRYVESKEALFHIVVDRAFQADPPALADTLPIPTPPAGATLKRLRVRLEEGLEFPRLESALAGRRVSDVRAEVVGIVGEFYERFEETREGADLLERSVVTSNVSTSCEVTTGISERTFLTVSRRSNSVTSFKESLKVGPP